MLDFSSFSSGFVSVVLLLDICGLAAFVIAQFVVEIKSALRDERSRK